MKRLLQRIPGTAALLALFTGLVVLVAAAPHWSPLLVIAFTPAVASLVGFAVLALSPHPRWVNNNDPYVPLDPDTSAQLRAELLVLDVTDPVATAVWRRRLAAHLTGVPLPALRVTATVPQPVHQTLVVAQPGATVTAHQPRELPS